jgi:hypothetical protein
MKREMTSLDVAMPMTAREAIEQLAAQETAKNKLKGVNRKVFAGDIVRRALEEYLARAGFQVTVDVNRGGKRRGEQESK